MLHVIGLAFVVQVFTADDTDMADTYPPDLLSLLNEFEDIFQTPRDLPPQRTCDHNIPFIHLEKTVAYSYPYFQKY